MKPAVQVVLWWERRRIVFNLALLSAGAVTTATVQLIGGCFAAPGENVIDPVVAVAAAAAYAGVANACYTLGWVLELPWTGGARDAHARARVFRVGLWAAVAVGLLPAVVFPAGWAISGFHPAPPPPARYGH